MTFNIGYIDSESQYFLKTVNFEDLQSSFVRKDTSELSTDQISLLFFDENSDLSGIESLFQKEAQYYPIVPANRYGLLLKDLKDLDFNQTQQIAGEIHNKWILNNNLQAISELPQRVDRIRELWRSDRHNALLEIWAFTKMNTGAGRLTILFKDTDQNGETENDEQASKRPALVNCALEGHKVPDFRPATESENFVMEKAFFDRAIEIEKDQPTRTSFKVQIGSSPLVILAESAQINTLQESLLTGYFKGISEF